MTDKPLLSICIPTYNRADYLVKSLDTLVSQDGFSEIEVVISDNASTDNTEEVVKAYQEKYPNIFYYQNKENIRDKNFPTVLMEAHGIFRKLYNDTILYEPDSIAYLLSVVKLYKESQSFIFFTHGRKEAKKVGNRLKAENCTFDELVRSTSHYLTWLAGFGFWEEDCIELEKEFDQCKTFLWQTYKGLKIAAEKSKNIVIIKKKMVSTQIVQKKDYTYGVYTVFFVNFPELLKHYLLSGQISEKTYYMVRKHMLFTLAGGWLKTIPKTDNVNFGKQTDFMQLIIENYKNEPYIHTYRIWMKWKEFVLSMKDKVKNNAFGRMLLNAKRKIRLKLY